MTTFASFSTFADMQTDDDFMEVSNDPERKNAMAMEEDHFDIDLDLGDGSQDGHDEDSMMDDEPSGQDGDQDQQMNDDFQEQGDQDDEVLDYIEDDNTVMEVPMTEEEATHQQNASASMQSLFNADVVPEALAFPSFTSHSPVVGTTSQTNDVHAADQQPAPTTLVQPGPTSLADDTGKLESIRTLYNDDVSLQASDNATQNQVAESGLAQDQAAAVGKESIQETRPNPDLSSPKIDHETARDETINTLPRDNLDDVLAPTEQPFDQVATHVEQSVETQEKAPDSESVEPAQTHEEENDGETSVPANADVDPSPGEQTTNMNEPEPVHPVIVTYQGHQMSLFPPTIQEGTPETYLLPDSAVFDRSISALLDTCHGVLAEGLENHEDIELFFPSFGFTFRKHDPEASEYTLRHISELCIQFQQCDGVEHHDPLNIELVVVASLAGRMNWLYDLASEGKGMKYVEELFSSESFDHVGLDSNAAGADDNGSHGTGTQARGAAEAEHDATGDGQSLEMPKIEETQSNGDEDPPGGGPEAGDDDAAEQAIILTEESAFGEAAASDHVPAHQEDESDKTIAADEQTDVDNLETEVEEVLRAQEEHPEGEKEGEAPALDENAQTAEEIDFEDDEWEVEDPTNVDNSNNADAQQTVLEHPIDTSQSLHSATEPDTATQTHSQEMGISQPEQLRDSTETRPEQSDSSSATLQDADNSNTLPTNNDPDDEDIFGDENDYIGVDTANDQVDVGEALEFGLEDTETKSPSLKRIRTEVDGVGDEAEDGEDHPLKRSRSG